MTTQELLRICRRKLREVNQAESDMTDEELLDMLSDAYDTLSLSGVFGTTTYAIVSDQTVSGYGVVPEPTTSHGHMLAIQAALSLLESEYRGRLFRGELGVSWRSGLESESTISAEKAYRDALEGMRRELSKQILLARATTAGSRVQ